MIAKAERNLQTTMFDSSAFMAEKGYDLARPLASKHDSKRNIRCRIDINDRYTFDEHHRIHEDSCNNTLHDSGYARLSGANSPNQAPPPYLLLLLLSSTDVRTLDPRH
uniref:Uncharacterized protein n=1 Tax=Vespula pensylvanica TaxID=30213 RepID=A0A834P503_VESPE|nr:hypothetical protein H0235_005631 [Vespula pensylvanica]